MTPATIKGVLVHEGLALLGRNPRDEWELLGGQPDASDRTVADTLTREFREESGIDIAVGRLLLADLFEVIPGRRVVVVAFAVSVLRSERLTSIMPSSGPAGAPEHTALQWFPCSELPAAPTSGVSASHRRWDHGHREERLLGDLGTGRALRGPRPWPRSPRATSPAGAIEAAVRRCCARVARYRPRTGRRRTG
ncbi:MAG: NUDIX domain-containing protein [Kineosporiaceae bacterium]|nr:NUDIX domain-containing protein [Kineosporiaceae bacterium]